MPRHKSRAWLVLNVTLRNTPQMRALQSCDGQQGTFRGAMPAILLCVRVRMQVPQTSSRAHAGVASMLQHVSGYWVGCVLMQRTPREYR